MPFLEFHCCQTVCNKNYSNSYLFLFSYTLISFSTCPLPNMQCSQLLHFYIFMFILITPLLINFPFNHIFLIQSSSLSRLMSCILWHLMNQTRTVPIIIGILLSAFPPTPFSPNRFQTPIHAVTYQTEKYTMFTL